MFQTQAHARSTESDRWSLEPTPARHPKKLARHVSSERARPLNWTPLPSPNAFPFLLEGRTEIVLHFEMPRSRKIGKRRPPRVLTLDRARHADRAKVLITMCEPPWTPRRRPVLSDTLRAGGPNPKRRSEFTKGDIGAQGRCFCARCFEDAVGFRLNDAEASEGVA